MKLLAILLWSISVSSVDQRADTYRACDSDAKTQLELNACAADEAARVDRRLDEVYQAVLSKAKEEPLAVENIKAAQVAWLVYRDAYMEAMYPAKDKLVEYGSVYPMEASLVRATLTGRQVAALRDLLEHYTGR